MTDSLLKPLLDALAFYADHRNYTPDGVLLAPGWANSARHLPIQVDKGAVAQNALLAFRTVDPPCVDEVTGAIRLKPGHLLSSHGCVTCAENGA